MDDLRIATFEDGTIHLIDFPKSKRHRFNSQRYTFVLETKIDKIRNFWRETIEQMLWQQLAIEKGKITNKVPIILESQISSDVHTLSEVRR